MHTLKLYHSVEKKVEEFTPHDPSRVTMYVCGPTVYSRPHIGNSRPVVIFDLLYRLLKRQFGYRNVLYVRNITDIDDKIIDAVKSTGKSIGELTSDVTLQYHYDAAVLGCLSPDFEPKATHHVPEMVEIIKLLIEKGYAYVAEKQVFFSVEKDEQYGKISGRQISTMLAGTRKEVNSAKKFPLDFVLWKPASKDDDPSWIFDSPWGLGRPGWHIECTAMSNKYLGKNFDIHGGGNDLLFPHHCNEQAQSTCAFPGSSYAKYWLHNGTLSVGNDKMSKSLGNIITVPDLVNGGVDPLVIRWFLLSMYYRKPLDYTEKNLLVAKSSMDTIFRTIELGMEHGFDPNNPGEGFYEVSLGHFYDDLNSNLALREISDFARTLLRKKQNILESVTQIFNTFSLIGFDLSDPESYFRVGPKTPSARLVNYFDVHFEEEMKVLKQARDNNDFIRADFIKSVLQQSNIDVEIGREDINWKFK